MNAEASPPDCPVCRSPLARPFHRLGRDFWRCDACRLVRQAPVPTPQELADYYDRAYREGIYLEFTRAAEMKRLTADARLRQLPSGWVRPGATRWLDVGCADGVLLDALRDRGVRGEGLELSAVAAERALAKGHTVHRARLEDFSPAEPYDVVSAYDVVEHASDPVAFLRGAARLLAPGGRLILSTPNLRSFSHLLMGRAWYFYIPMEHLTLFGPHAIGRALDAAGLRTVALRAAYKPLTFDYAQKQFQETNPLVHRLLAPFGAVLPARLRGWAAPLWIGELLALAVLPADNPAPPGDA